MIIIACYKVIENKCVIQTVRVLEKYPIDNCPFNYEDRIECYKYLVSKYSNIKTKEGIPVCYRIYNWGTFKGMKKGTNISFFPGYDIDGNTLNVGQYGRLEYFIPLMRKLKEKEEHQKKENQGQLPRPK